MPMVHTCAQLYAARCLWVGPVGVARFTKISRGAWSGFGQKSSWLKSRVKAKNG